jgi:hypothetical protein
LIERDVGRVVAGNDAATGVENELGLDADRRFVLIPAVIDTLGVIGVEAIRRVA